MSAWTDHIKRWDGCTKCELAQQRNRMCFARSEWPQGADRPNVRVPCDVLFVGEAPGERENDAGLPFVGPAGNLMDQIIQRALPPDVTYTLTNLVCCYPREAKLRGDNEPEREEILSCRPRLVEFANVARPRLTVCVGDLAHRYVKDICTGPTIDIWHPAYILAWLPQAQKGFASNKCSVQIRSAWFKVLESPRVAFTNWGDKTDASIQERFLDQHIPF